MFDVNIREKKELEHEVILRVFNFFFTVDSFCQRMELHMSSKEKDKGRGNVELGSHIKRTRRFFKVTQEEVAQHLEMSLRNYQNIEGGKQGLNVLTHAKLIQTIHTIHATRSGVVFDEDKLNKSISEDVKRLYERLLKWI
jgi:DNA-binding XRE family transcriptional regulator